MYNVTVRRFRESTVAVEIDITYSDCVYVALGIQHTMSISHFVICGLPDSTTYFHNIS